MNFNNYKFVLGKHQDRDVIWIHFSINDALKNDLKKRFSSVKWSQSNKCWYLLDLPAVRRVLGIPLKDFKEKLLLDIHPTNQKALQAYISQLELKGYSRNTIRIYCAELSHLLRLVKDFPVEKLSAEKLKAYFLYCLKEEKMKERKLNGKINAIKFYFEKVLHREKMFFDIPRPKKPVTLPKMLTQREVKLLFKQVTNPKHLLALQLCYGMGLRVSL